MATSVADRAETRRTGRQVIAVSDLVLASKITIPRVPGWAVPRLRINELMARGGRWSPLTVLTGPPGAGKTMALALWAAADHGAVAWVTLDDYDNQPTVFWSNVVAALHRAGVAVPGVSPAAVPEEAVGHLFLRWLASALADQDPPVTLIIDDLHLLTESSVLDSLDYVLRNAGSGLRLVVTSRMDPLLPLHRYRLACRLTDIRFGDLALSVPETGLLMAQHGIELSADSLECLTQRTEGWAAGIRLAAISMATHPDPDQFVKELIAEDSAVTGYLVDEALNTQPPEVRDLLLRTSVLERVSDDIAAEMAGQEHAAGILREVAHANAFVQPAGHGWYRYHPLFAEVLRLKLRREYPEGIAALHYRAARWFERNGPLTDAVRHAAEAGDWKLAAGMAIDGLAIGEIIEPRGSRSLAGEFRGMPDSVASSELQPLLVSAAIALSAGRYDLSTASLGAAQRILDLLPGHQEAASRLAAAMIRLAASRRTGDLTGAAAAAASAEVLVDRVTDQKLARHPEIRTRVLSYRGAVELWSGRLGAAARALDLGVAAATDSGAEYERAECLGYLALVEALRGGLGRAVKLCSTPRRHRKARRTAAHASVAGSPGRAGSPYCQRSTTSAHRSASTGRPINAQKSAASTATIGCPSIPPRPSSHRSHRWTVATRPCRWVGTTSAATKPATALTSPAAMEYSSASSGQPFRRYQPAARRRRTAIRSGASRSSSARSMSRNMWW